MLKTILILITTCLLYSCAKIPVQSLDLTDAIIKEGERMHQLNVKLLNKMFKEKSEKIDDFIKNNYTPEYLEKFNKNIADSVVLKTELPSILNSIITVINSRRNIMQNALEENRIKLIAQLELDFYTYSISAYELRILLESAVDVERERRELFDMIKDLTGKKLDLNQVESSIDTFIFQGGNTSESFINFNNSINSIINKKGE